jgi:hypothetical protein
MKWRRGIQGEEAPKNEKGFLSFSIFPFLEEEAPENGEGKMKNAGRRTKVGRRTLNAEH